MKYSAYSSTLAERDISGAILTAPIEALEQIRATLSATDFYNGDAQAIYKAATSLVDRGEAADVTLIIQRALEQGHTITEATAREFLDHCPAKANLQALAEIVRNAAIHREAAEIGQSMTAGEITPLEALGKLQELTSRQIHRRKTPQETVNAFADYVSAVAAGEVRPFVSTGFDSLDTQLSGGFIQSGYITLAARPGVGKTTVAVNLAENVAAQGKGVLYISLEMDERQIMARRVGAAAGVSYSSIYGGKLTDRDWTRYNDAMQTLYNRPFYIHDKPCTVEDIEREIRCIDNLSLVVIDHIGLLKCATGRSRYEAVTEISHRLKQIALSTGIPILALCQLNRASEAKESKLPSLAELRDSGAIEEDSDAVMLLSRPAMFADEENKPKPWEAQTLAVLVEKNRHGMTGTVKFDFIGMTAKIREV